MLLTVSNLFPRPDQPQRGLFNAQLFQEFRRQWGKGGTMNVCLVPEWRIWRWDAIRRWTEDGGLCTVDRDRRTRAHQGGPSLPTVHGLPSTVPTLYTPVFYVPGIGRDWMWWTYYRCLRQRTSDFLGTRAVFATWLYPDGVAAARLAVELAVPCWIMVQGSDIFHLRYPRRRKALLRVARDVQGFVCVSRPLAEALIAVGIHRSKVHVVPNGVDGTLFQYRAKRDVAGEGWEGEGWKGGGPTFAKATAGRGRWEGKREMPSPTQGETQRPTSNVQVGGSSPSTINHQPSTLADVIAGRRKLVLFVGNLVPVKGPDVFLKSISLLQSSAFSLQPIVSVIIGDGPMRRDLERAAQRAGLGDSVLFLGSRPHAEVARWMNVADVLCLTSRSEGMPNVVIEALVSGLPVVVTDVGACRELVKDEPLARWCLPGDTRALAGALQDLLSMSADRPSMAARHGPRYSWALQAQKILELMRMGRRLKDET